MPSYVIATLALLSVVSGISGQVAYQYCNSTNTNCPAWSSCYMANPCQMGECVCNLGYVLNQTATTFSCVAQVKVGASCTAWSSYISNCMGEYTMCTAGTCQCAVSSYTVNSASTDCVPPTPIPAGGACNSTNYNCITYSACSNMISNGVCTCNCGYYQSGQSCVLLQLNNPCNATNCPPTSAACCYGATCASGTYQCTSGYTWNTASCLPNTWTYGALGAVCDDQTKWCNTGLTCNYCPGNTTTLICQSAMTQPGGTTTGPSGGTTTPKGTGSSTSLSATVATTLLLTLLTSAYKFIH